MTEIVLTLICMLSMVGIIVILFKKEKQCTWLICTFTLWEFGIWISNLEGKLSVGMFLILGVISIFLGWIVRNKQLDWFIRVGKRVFNTCGCIGIGFCIGVYMLIGTDVNHAWNVITENGNSTRWEDTLPINLKLPYPTAKKLLILEGLQLVDMADYIGESIQSKDSGIIDKWDNSGLPSNYLMGNTIKKFVDNPNNIETLNPVNKYQGIVSRLRTIVTVEQFTGFYVGVMFACGILRGIRKCVNMMKRKRRSK